MSNGAPPPVPGTAPAKQGLSPWAWVAIGCGGLVVVGFIIFMALGFFAVKKGKEIVEDATGSGSLEELMQDLQDNPVKTAAETAVRINPDLELLSSDDEAGTLTFRNNKTGEEATLNFEDIAEGKFSVTTDEGEYSVDAVDEGEGGVTFKGPEGEARFGAATDLGDVPDWVPRYPGGKDEQNTFHTVGAGGFSGAMSAKTQDGPQKVLDHFKDALEDGGFEIGAQSMTKTPGGAYAGVSGVAGDGRSVNVAIVEQAGECLITINYGKKE